MEHSKRFNRSLRCLLTVVDKSVFPVNSAAWHVSAGHGVRKLCPRVHIHQPWLHIVYTVRRWVVRLSLSVNAMHGMCQHYTCLCGDDA